MPTATTTTTSTDNLHKPPSSKVASTSTTATLRTLYARAARAFLHRDIDLTHSLLASAFALLSSPATPRDALSDQRRKWDILRITTEVTVYTSPPEDSASIPASLRANAILSGASLISSLHARSIRLFSPGAEVDAAYLPAQVVVTLALASIKVFAPTVGRSLVEEWLSRRIQWQDPSGEDSYEKVLDVYCLSILPLLDEWEYAGEFLSYESELPQESKQRIVSTLASLHGDRLAALASATITSPPAALPQATPTPSRPTSPSSSSTTSTGTAVPSTPRARQFSSSNNMTPLSPLPRTFSAASSSSISSAQSSRTVTPHPGAPRTLPKFRSPSRSPVATTVTAPPLTPATTTPPVTTLAVLRVAFQQYIERLPRFSVLFVLCILLPLVSLLLRLRRRRTKAAGAGIADVRRRLGSVKEAGLLSGLWKETVRAVRDTVTMGGRGLV